MDRIEKLREERNELVAKVEALTVLAQEEDRDFSDEEQAEIDTIIGAGEGDEGEVGVINNKIKREERLASIRMEIAAKRSADKIVPQTESGQVNVSNIVVPAEAKSRSAIKSFNGPDAEKEAYLAGLFYSAAMFGNKASAQRLGDCGIQMAQQVGDDTLGGYLVPTVLENRLIRLVEEYGVARRVARVLPMGVGGTFNIPRRTDGYTAYFVDELATGTESDITLDQISLVAKKIMVLSKWSTELPEDALVKLGDIITAEIAYCFAQKEDDCYFNGDGTANYGSITGWKSALLAGSKVTAATGVTTLGDVTLGVFEEAIGKLPLFPGIAPKWYMHHSVWANVCQRLAMAAGGNMVENFVNGVPQRSFMGYPVEIAQVMAGGAPGTDLTGETVMYFGDAAMGSTFGDKRGVTIDTDSSVYFTSDAIALRATERFDINCHEVGSATEAGPMIGIDLAAS